MTAPELEESNQGAVPDLLEAAALVAARLPLPDQDQADRLSGLLLVAPAHDEGAATTAAPTSSLTHPRPAAKLVGGRRAAG